MNIRQVYLDATSGKRHIKEIEIRLEDSRDTHSPIFSQVNILATCDDHLLNVSVDKEVLTLLDNKRTFIPPSVIQTYLTEKSTGNEPLKVADVSGFDLGDPVVIMSDKNGRDKQFAIISLIDTNEIGISHNAAFSRGSIVQNLANRWVGDPLNELGINAKLSRPEALPFQLVPDHGKVTVHVTTPISTGTIKCYDVYIRPTTFNKIESGWLADLQNVDINESAVCVSTCDGIALMTGNVYFVAVVSKDAKKTDNVNESPCFVETFTAI